MSSLSQAASSVEKRTNARYWIVVMLFIVTSFNYGDRATLSIAGSEMAKDIGLDPVGMGYVFSAFSWAYVIGQIPGGWLLDRFGSKRVYFWSIFIWSMFTLLQGFVDIFSGFGIIVALFTLRFLVGLAEAPSFPGNSRIVAAWFPAQERGTAVSIFNSAQYFATVIFAPIMGWLTHEVGWSHVFFFMGGAEHFGLQRLMLHASQLSLTHPFTGEPLTIHAGLDDTWMQALSQFGWRGLLPENERVEFSAPSGQDGEISS